MTYFYADKRRIMVGDDLKGKTFAMSDPDSNSGSLIPFALRKLKL